jgi:hypothetical protein
MATSKYDQLQSLTLKQASEVACLLTERWAAFSRMSEVPIVVVGNYIAQEFLDGWSTSQQTKKALACAEKNGLRVIDLWDEHARRQASGGDAAIEALYLPQRGHYSVEGSRLTAQVIAKYLREVFAGCGATESAERGAGGVKSVTGPC